NLAIRHLLEVPDDVVGQAEPRELHPERSPDVAPLLRGHQVDRLPVLGEALLADEAEGGDAAAEVVDRRLEALAPDAGALDPPHALPGARVEIDPAARAGLPRRLGRRLAGLARLGRSFGLGPEELHVGVVAQSEDQEDGQEDEAALLT